MEHFEISDFGLWISDLGTVRAWSTECEVAANKCEIRNNR